VSHLTHSEPHPILQAIANGEPWQFNRACLWIDALSDQDPVFQLTLDREIRLTPKPEKWAAEKAAHAAGKRIEMWSPRSKTWVHVPSPAWQGDAYRIAPEPTYIPLGPEDVPPGSVIRGKGWSIGLYVDCFLTVLETTPRGVWVSRSEQVILWEVLMTHWQILRPGKTVWEECRKEAK